MPGMAKKKPKAESEQMLTGTDARKGSRHKPRKTIALSPRRYELLQELARRNKRPTQWEAWIAIDRALVEAGLLSQEEADAMMSGEADAD